MPVARFAVRVRLSKRAPGVDGGGHCARRCDGGRVASASRHCASPPVTRFEIAVPPTDSPTSLALSPDGRQLAYVATTEGQSRLWVRLLDDTTARALAGTEGASFPFWAPDGRAIGFFAEGKLKRVDLAGGAPQVLADAPNGRGGTWNPEGVILFTPGNVASAPNSVITRVSAGGRHANGGDASCRWRRQPPVATVSPRWTPVHFLQHARSRRHPGRVPRVA